MFYLKHPSILCLCFFFSFSQKLCWDSENILGLKSGNLIPWNLLLLLLFYYSWHASREIFIAAVVSPSTLGTCSMNPCHVPHQMRHHPFSHWAAWEASQCMKRKPEERGHNVFCTDSLQKSYLYNRIFWREEFCCVFSFYHYLKEQQNCIWYIELFGEIPRIYWDFKKYKKKVIIFNFAYWK